MLCSRLAIYFHQSDLTLFARTSKQLADATMTVTATPLPNEVPSIEIVAPAADVPQEVEESYDFEEVQSLSIWDVLEAQSKICPQLAVFIFYLRAGYFIWTAL